MGSFPPKLIPKSTTITQILSVVRPLKIAFFPIELKQQPGSQF